MKTANFLTSSCRYCRYYQTEGRRGGVCQQLGVPVQSQWKACALACHPFTTPWENLRDVVRLEGALVTECSLEQLTPKHHPTDDTIAPKQVVIV